MSYVYYAPCLASILRHEAVSRGVMAEAAAEEWCGKGELHFTPTNGTPRRRTYRNRAIISSTERRTQSMPCLHQAPCLLYYFSLHRAVEQFGRVHVRSTKQAVNIYNITIIFIDKILLHSLVKFIILHILRKLSVSNVVSTKFILSFMNCDRVLDNFEHL